MNHCAACGLHLMSDVALCRHHHCVYGDGWAESNRLLCDFFHRGIVPQRLSPATRNGDTWAHWEEVV